MNCGITKRSVYLNGHKTAISLEDEFYECLKEIARLHQKSIAELVGEINNSRLLGNLSSAVRVFVLAHYKGCDLEQSKSYSGDLN